ncbi:hypothetical protein ACWDG1_30395 [Streptomyces sp. NPDC001177]
MDPELLDEEPLDLLFASAGTLPDSFGVIVLTAVFGFAQASRSRFLSAQGKGFEHCAVRLGDFGGGEHHDRVGERQDLAVSGRSLCAASRAVSWDCADGLVGGSRLITQRS